MPSTPASGSPARPEVGWLSERLRHLAVVLLLAVLVGVGLGTAPAFAVASLSPSEVLTAQEIGFVVSVSSDTVDLTSAVGASLPEGFTYLSCDAPEGWSCGLEGSGVQWARESSLDPNDARFVMTLRTPDTAGDRIFQLSDRRASGAASNASSIVTVRADEPVVAEPSEEPTDQSTEAPLPEETHAEVVDDRPAPAIEPFRPPDGDDDEAPISIRDLPEVVAATDAPTTTTAAESGGGISTTTLVVAPVALLLLLSFGGFVTASLNR